MKTVEQIIEMIDSEIERYAILRDGDNEEITRQMIATILALSRLKYLIATPVYPSDVVLGASPAGGADEGKVEDAG